MTLLLMIEIKKYCIAIINKNNLQIFVLSTVTVIVDPKYKVYFHLFRNAVFEIYS